MIKKEQWNKKEFWTRSTEKRWHKMANLRYWEQIRHSWFTNFPAKLGTKDLWWSVIEEPLQSTCLGLDCLIVYSRSKDQSIGAFGQYRSEMQSRTEVDQLIVENSPQMKISIFWDYDEDRQARDARIHQHCMSIIRLEDDCGQTDRVNLERIYRRRLWIQDCIYNWLTSCVKSMEEENIGQELVSHRNFDPKMMGMD